MRHLDELIPYLLGASAALAALSVGTPAPAQTRAALEPVILAGETIVVERDVIRVGDVFDAGPQDALDRPLARAPRPGSAVTFAPDRLQQLARAHGLYWANAQGVRRIVVRRDSIAVEPARIEAALAGAVSARLGGVWAVTLSDPHTRHAPMGSDVTLRVDAVEIDEARGRMTASVRVTQDGASETVRARLDALVQVPVLARPIARGAVIDAADVVMADRPASDVRATAIADAAALIGHAARRALPAGQPVRASDLERPAAIARGQTLSVEWRSGPLRLTVQGQALGDAAVGESVRIVNVASHRTIEATVIAPGRAVVAAPPAFAARPANGAAL